MTAGWAPGRLAAAFCASLLVHALAAALFAELARGWQLGSLLSSGLGRSPLNATLRALPPEATGGASLVAPPPQGAPARGPASAPEAAALPLPAAVPRYFAPKELDERPLIMNHVEPRFPQGAPVPSGRVKMRLFINRNGLVDQIEILEAEPPGTFEAAAAEAFAAARFRPGMRGGAPVASRLAVEVLFGSPLPEEARPPATAGIHRAPPENPNAFDAPDRAIVKKRRKP